ncbi:META domain-containing protein [Niabella ginsengisoli]|uniref:META domain-containing protein n=1 Tax=Niabella ginsengisoli TaxID=522298 RepID=A0ABS9SG78_9BACT|nr:META domain-containing protein [Niabella ginsengisoli]MCH5597363.1 META domain-containing protein [Niabella ginsengisoli]
METTSLTGKKWKLIEIGGQPVADKINNKEPFIEFNSGEENRYTASGGCNGLGGTYTSSDNGKIKFEQGMSTMMACEDMSIENQLKNVFGTADNYTIANNILSLNKAKMAPLARFQAVTTVNEGALLNGSWEVDYISGPRIAFNGLYPNKKPTITFNLPDTIATGNSSCNNFRVSFKLDGGNIKFGMPMSTKMACEGQGESTFFKTLQTINKFSISENTLTLIMGDIAVMRLQKK